MKPDTLPAEDIGARILFVRSHKVMLDADLAALYGVPTKVLVQAVRRNIERFPQDFMFQLTEQELGILRSQIVTSSSGDPGKWGGRRTLPYAFSEQGVAMLSSVLRSSRAIAVNIAIMSALPREFRPVFCRGGRRVAARRLRWIPYNDVRPNRAITPG